MMSHFILIHPSLSQSSTKHRIIQTQPNLPNVKQIGEKTYSLPNRDKFLKINIDELMKLNIVPNNKMAQQDTSLLNKIQNLLQQDYRGVNVGVLFELCCSEIAGHNSGSNFYR